MSSIDLGSVTAYSIAVKNGFTGTEAEWMQAIIDAGEYAQEAAQNAESAVASAQSAEASAVRAEILYGSPLIANTVADMTEENRVYVYVGSETGYTNGNWYYYDGTTWTSGGVYNGEGVNTDPSLSIEDMPADAKAVGDAIEDATSDLKSDLNNLSEGKVIVPYTVINNKGFDVSDGTFPNENNWDITDYIPVVGGETIHIYNGAYGHYYNGFYTSDKTYIGNFTIPIGSDVPIIVPENASYMVITNRHSSFDYVVWRIAPVIIDLESEMAGYGVLDYIGHMDLNSSSRMGVDFDWTGKSCYVHGTATNISYHTLFINEWSLPFGFKAGKTYYIKYSGTNVRLRIYDYTGGNVTDLVNTINDTILTIPPDCTGLIIRLWVANNTSVNETVTPIITSGYDINELTALTKKAILNNALDYDVIASCDDITDDCIYFVSSSEGVLSIPDAPYLGWIQTVNATSNIALQIAYPYNTSDVTKLRVKQLGTWSNWVANGGTTTIIQEVSRDTYENTYNITTSPTITTDANGWLQPVDTDTSSETGKTDMTGAIMSMLTDTGYCHLAEGIYYVSGSIDIPTGATLEGCGRGTIIRLLSSVTSGYICRLKEYSTIKNIRFSGGYSQGDISDGNIGGRKGIIFIGNRDGQDSGVTPSTTKCCQITGCWFENLDSGIYGYNAGGGLQEGLIVSDCYITRCKAGINLDYWTEYCKFTNVVIFQCYYACINNGGNNVFTACTFHGVIGFLIDNSGGNKNNNGHGSVIGCTFNHIDNMNNPSQLGKGIGIKVLNISNGFLFANCQLWYGRIHIEDSEGVQITGCEFGGIGNSSYPVIESSGNGTLFVDNCLFSTAPTFNISSPKKFTNCWTYGGVAVTGS